MTASDTLAAFNPFDPDALSTPAPGWAMLRREAPIYRIALEGAPVPVFMATRRREIDYICRHTELFSNTPPTAIWRWGGGDFEPSLQAIFDETGRRALNTLQASDPPDSLAYRKVVTDAIGPGRVKRWKGEIHQIVADLVAAIPDGQPVNMVEAFSVPLPLRVICLILGLPYDEADFFRFYSDEFTHLVDPVHPIERARIAIRTIVKGYGMLESKILDFQREPADNLLSAIANAQLPDGQGGTRPITLDEAVSMAHVTVIAGNETTRNALSSALFTLARDPALWNRLHEDRSRVAPFIEEVLRRDAPATTTPRTALADVELGGVTIPAGSCVFVMWGAGSLDEEVFDDPLAFDIDRRNKSAHASFGMGVHHCAGSALARAEMQEAVNAWLDAFERVELAVPAHDVRYDPIFGFHALSDLPVIFTRRAAA